jgi:arylsulfatase
MLFEGEAGVSEPPQVIIIEAADCVAAAHNFLDVKHFVVKSDQAVSAGKHELKMTFNYEGGKEVGKSGTITLSVDGKTVGSGKVDQTTPFKYSLSGNQDIGSDTGTLVVYDYQAPFAFQGQLGEVVVELTN